MKGLDMFLVAIIILAVSAQIANSQEQFKKRIHNNQGEFILISMIFAIGTVIIMYGFQGGRQGNIKLGIFGILICVVSAVWLLNNFSFEKTNNFLF